MKRREQFVFIPGLMAGYSLKEILKLMQEDRLIDSYTIEPDNEIMIHMDGEQVRCTAEEATDLLLQRIRGVTYGGVNT